MPPAAVDSIRFSFVQPVPPSVSVPARLLRMTPLFLHEPEPLPTVPKPSIVIPDSIVSSGEPEVGHTRLIVFDIKTVPVPSSDCEPL